MEFHPMPCQSHLSRKIHGLSARFLPVFLFLATPAMAQVHFSIDRTGPTVGAPNSFSGVAITPADILAPATVSGAPALGPLPVPGTVIPETALGLAGDEAHELDALSYGVDRLFNPYNQDEVMSPFGIHFSVDDFAIGIPGSAVDVASESPVADACADVFASSLIGLNIGVIDGDGLPSGSGAVYPGVGLVEPGTPGNQDDLDALDMETSGGGHGFPGMGVFFSLDTSYIDPITGTPHAATAISQGVVGGDILLATSPGSFSVYAPATLLGLDLVAGPDSDDLDALILWENGDGDYQPSHDMFPWLTGGDMVLFSVRRGSAVIGMPDSLMGIPICEGDILMPPVFGAAGSPFPAILIPAEALGLATLRSGTANYSDDLDAADYVWTAPELITDEYCLCDSSAPAPCSNYDPTAGCVNSTGVGARLVASGTSSVIGTLTMTASLLPPGQPGVLFTGPSPALIPFKDGLLCVTGTIRRLAIGFSGASGSITYTGVVGLAAAKGLVIAPGDTWFFQTWFRDPAGPCSKGSNLTNGVSVLFW
jgi:hypothetical protein